MDNTLNAPGNKKNKLALFYSRSKRKLFASHLRLVRVVLLFIAALSMVYALSGLHSLWLKSVAHHYVEMAQGFAFPDYYLNNTERYNLLLLGVGGEGHDAPDLTDTMLLLSIGRVEPRRMVMISVPRDIWVPDIKDKINASYKIGKEQKSVEAGLLLARTSIEEILGVKIDGAIVIDFSGFREIIDFLGGVDIEVERAFTDEKYPIAGRESDSCGGDPEFLCRYETVSFETGTVHMDGELALKFARSRHSSDPDEGNDLARAARQQKIIGAIKNKIMSKDFIYSPLRLVQLWKLADDYIEKDFSDVSLAAVSRIGYDAKDNINAQVLPEEMLTNPPTSPQYNNLYVFLPKEENWKEVHLWAGSLLP